MVRGFLTAHGYRVVEAANGIEALALSEQHAGSIHLLMSDMVMPQMSGKELARRLILCRPDLKVLYVSGYANEAIVHTGMLGPNTHFLQNPFTPDTLAGKVRELLDSRRAS